MRDGMLYALQDLATAAANVQKEWDLVDAEDHRKLEQAYPDTLPDFYEVENALYGWAADYRRQIRA